MYWNFVAIDGVIKNQYLYPLLVSLVFLFLMPARSTAQCFIFDWFQLSTQTLIL
jgi:hypothetical protein